MSYSFARQVLIDKLMEELFDFPVTHITMEESEGAYVTTVHTSTALDLEDFTAMELIVMSHSTVDMRGIVRQRILAAMDFGKGLIAEYGAMNVLASFSVAQIQYIMEATSAVQAALNTGSLYVALDELAAVPNDELLITVERVTEVRNRIQDYLGIART